jgi:hypothetical protein
MAVVIVVAVIVAVHLGAWALCRISAIADNYTLHEGKPPEDWR